MNRFPFALAALLIAGLLAGCGGTTDSGKPKPADQTKPSDQQSKKDTEPQHKPLHEPSGD